MCDRLGLLVVPKQRPEILPCLRVAVKIDHRVEHARLDRFAAVAEQVHDAAPRQGREHREPLGIGWQWSHSATAGRRRAAVWRGCARNERCHDTRDNVEHDLPAK